MEPDKEITTYMERMWSYDWDEHTSISEDGSYTGADTELLKEAIRSTGHRITTTLNEDVPNQDTNTIMDSHLDTTKHISTISDRDLMNELFKRGLIIEYSSAAKAAAFLDRTERAQWEAQLRREAVSAASSGIHASGGDDILYQLIKDPHEATTRCAVYVCKIPKKG